MQSIGPFSFLSHPSSHLDHLAEDADGNFVGSCCGFYGEEGLKDAIAYAKDDIDCELRSKLKSHLSKRKAQIKSHTPFYARTAFAF